MTPKRQVPHCGSVVFARIFGILPFLASCFNLSNDRWPIQQCQCMSWLSSAAVLISRSSELEKLRPGEKLSGKSGLFVAVIHDAAVVAV